MLASPGKMSLRASDSSLGPPIYKIVLTGGPCAGKSTALVLVSERLQTLGFSVYCVPEAATIAMTGGVALGASQVPDDVIRDQLNIIKMQMTLEDTFCDWAKMARKPSVIICDRGIMDGRAYMSEATWNRMMELGGYDIIKLRDRRYNIVVFLETAAINAEKFYTTTNNTHRRETIEEAREVDERTRMAWVGHPHLTIVPNDTHDFYKKLKNVFSVICNMVGVPVASNFRRKFLVANATFDIPVKHETFHVEQTFIISPPNVQSRLIKRSSKQGKPSFSIFIREFYPPLTDQHMSERHLSKIEYRDLLARADPSRVTLKVTRKVFLHNQSYFSIDIFQEPHRNLIALQIEMDHDSEVPFPPFLQPIKEVTDDDAYSSYNLAQRDYVLPHS